MGPKASHEVLPNKRLILASKALGNKRLLQKSIFLNEDSSDVEILVTYGDRTWRYPCHKIVLIKHIPKLANMCPNDGNRITISNHKPQVVEQVLRCAYQKHVHMEDWTSAQAILNVASEYEMVSLVEECEMFLTQSLTLGNVCYCLDSSLALELPTLGRRCKELCEAAAFVVLKSTAFSEMSLRVVRFIASLENLNVKSELNVFEALWNWAKLECVRQSRRLSDDVIIETAFNDVAGCVGFELMTAGEKNNLPNAIRERYTSRLSASPTEALPGDENITRGKYLRFEPLLLTDYSKSTIFRTQDKITQTVQRTHLSCIKFSVNVDTYLLGFVILCLHNQGQNTNSVEKLKITTPSETLLSWQHGVDESQLIAQEAVLHTASVFDDTKVAETTFMASTMIPLHAGTVYELILEPRESTIKWPVVFPQWHDSKFDYHNISLHSDFVYSLKSSTFLQMPSTVMW